MSYRFEDDGGVALLQETWDAQLRDESHEQDIYTGLAGTFSEDEKGNGKMADGIFQRVRLKPGANTHTIGLVKDLTGAGRIGGGKNLRGFLETPTTRHMTVYSNDVRHGTENELYGIHHHRLIPYKKLMDSMNKSNGLLARWWKARKGRYIRQSYVQGFSDNLVETPTSQTLRWNRNILVKNVAQASQPTYDSTLSQYESAIKTALSAAGVTTAASLDAGFFSVLNYFITNIWKIEPMDNGKYIVTVPARQAVYLKDLSETTSLSRIQASTFSEQVAGLTFQQVLGEIGNMILVVDDRSPVVVWDTVTQTLTAAYRDVGDVDDRNDYSNDGVDRVYDVICVHGKASITETTHMDLRFDTQLEDIGRVEEVGLAVGTGYQVTEYEHDTPTDSTRIGQNCGIALAYSGSVTP